MPELPDVEIYKRYVDRRALRQPISHVHVAAPRLLSGVSSGGLRRVLLRHRFTSSRRHGKHLFLRIGRSRWLMLHFGMTGWLSYAADASPAPRYTQLRLEFTHGRHLAYVEPRKLGRIALTPGPERFVAAHRLGPDALELDFSVFRGLASKARGGVKPWLMNQRVIAGIGNIYADEILFQARLHPLQTPQALKETELRRLFRSLRTVLEQAIAAEADAARMPKTFLLPQRRRGGRCPRCRGALRTMTAGGRTTYYCPQCQRRAMTTRN